MEISDLMQHDLQKNLAQWLRPLDKMRIIAVYTMHSEVNHLQFAYKADARLAFCITGTALAAGHVLYV